MANDVKLKNLPYKSDVWFRIIRALEQGKNYDKAGELLGKNFSKNKNLSKYVNKDGKLSKKRIDTLLKWSIISELYARGIDTVALGKMLQSNSGRVLLSMKNYNLITIKPRTKNVFYPFPNINSFPIELVNAMKLVKLKEGEFTLHDTFLAYYKKEVPNKMLYDLSNYAKKGRPLGNVINAYNNKIKLLGKVDSKGVVARSYNEKELRQFAKERGFTFADLPNKDIRRALKNGEF